MLNKLLMNFKSIKSIKSIIITISIIMGIVAFIKVINFIEDSGWLENKDRKLGQLEAIKRSYSTENKDLSKTISTITKINKLNDKIINNLIVKEKTVKKKFTNIKKNTTAKLKYIKKISKTIPKNISEPYVKVNTYIYRESGKVLINSIYKAYNDIKDVK